MGSKVDINTCADACTHSKQGVGTEIRWLGHKHTTIHGCQSSIKLCIRGVPHISSQVDINSCTDQCTHSKQGVGPQPGWMGHRQSDTQEHPTFHVTIHRGWTRHRASKVDIYSCTDACTHSKPGVATEMRQMGLWTQRHIGAPKAPWNYAYGVQQTWGVRWT